MADARSVGWVLLVSVAACGGAATTDGGPDGATRSDAGASDGGGPRDAGTFVPDAGPGGVTGTPGPATPMTATYFVDFTAGDDTHDGRSQAMAWKHCPGDASATGVASSATLHANDVVLFKGGVEYDGAIDVNAAGSPGMPLFFDGNVHGRWGTGAAIIDGQRTRDHGFAVQDESWVTIDGFAIRRMSTDTSSTGVLARRGSHVEVRGCDISEIYFATNPGGTSWEAQNGVGIFFDRIDDGEIHHNRVRDVGNSGIGYNSQNGVMTTGGEIFANEVTNMNIGIRVTLGNADPGTGLSGLRVLGNDIHDFDQYYVSPAWHRDGIHVFARPETDAVTITDVEIAGNYFADHTSAPGSTAWIYLEYACERFRIHHNVLNASRSYYAIRILGDGFVVPGDHVIANNTIWDVNEIGGAGIHIDQSTGVKLYDNVFWDDDQAYFVRPDSMPGFDSDYNLFYRVGSTTIATLNAGPAEAPTGDSHDLAGLQSMTPFDHHSLFGDPLFTVAPAMITSDPTGFVPQSTSPAVDHGNAEGFTTDYRGAPVPMGSAPDIGAFEVR